MLTPAQLPRGPRRPSCRQLETVWRRTLLPHAAHSYFYSQGPACQRSYSSTPAQFLLFRTAPARISAAAPAAASLRRAGEDDDGDYVDAYERKPSINLPEPGALLCLPRVSHAEQCRRPAWPWAGT